MGVLWTQNNWRNRAVRLCVKVGESPFLPTLAIGKLFETLITSGPVTEWTVASVIAILWFILAEDFAEAIGDSFEEIEDHFSGE